MKNYLTLIIVLFIVTDNILANNYIDSLKQVEQNANSTIDKLSIQLEIAEYYQGSNPKEAIQIANKVLSSKNITQYQYEQCIANRIKGIAYSNLFQIDSAIASTEKALQIAQTIKNLEKIMSCNHDLGIIYSKIGAYKVSTNYFLKALKSLEKLNNTNLITNATPMILNSIATNYAYLNQFDLSNQYYLKAYNKSKSKKVSATSLSNLGINYLENNELDSALWYTNKSIQLLKNENDAFSLNDYYRTLSNIYALKGDFYKAQEYIDTAIAYFKSIDDDWSLAYCYDNKGEAYRLEKKYNLAEPLLLNAYQTLLDYEDFHAVVDVSKHLYQLYEATNQPNKALYYYKQFRNLDDSISNANLASDILHMDKIYQTEKKEAQIQLLEKDNELKQAKIKRISIAIASIILIILLLLYLLNILRKSNKYKTETNAILKEKNEQLRTLNATKDKLFSIVSHDLKNPLSAFRNITGALQKQLFNLSKEEINDFIINIHDSSNKLLDLLQNILKWSVSQTNNIKVNHIQQDIEPIVQHTIDTLMYTAKEKEITITNEINSNTIANFDKDIVETVIRNLLSNAIKFTPNHGIITINSETINNNRLKINIIDNGIGISKADQMKLFNITEDIQSVGTSKEKGTGLGLILCKELIDKMEATIGVESEIEQGSTFYIILNT